MGECRWDNCPMCKNKDGIIAELKTMSRMKDASAKKSKIISMSESFELKRLREENKKLHEENKELRTKLITG